MVKEPCGEEAGEGDGRLGPHAILGRALVEVVRPVRRREERHGAHDENCEDSNRPDIKV